MDFFWIGLLFWLLMGFSVFFLMLGLMKNRRIHFVFSALLFLPVAYYFRGAENAWKFMMFYPLIPILLAIFFVKKR
ncbi:putative membrane protein [Anoxybacillus sp. B7M1]|jgi:hypothetical protein|uniref:Uncharacterized protein n=1 Tax=Anoxybacteroides rupiense TaxID=311460 RepID=A0ABD5IUD2_9BACL|nr:MULTISPECIES: hypothetical protein [Anoxybacillus]ANB58562.1 putative membrane protein [Anoxybacillus sp. B2M1]ANB63075.1 putative membrane protein [Anoxybacillus sp. B7M1]KXG11444.1 hypothetical protein AT864_00527 [Anoxybacillus sp. P3H1B]MBB3907228.1 hypothetical protein [Anoxybacillus rupiensis]MBS2771564.1 hypothetical protein [Anoxybacillus rupiensis]